MLRSEIENSITKADYDEIEYETELKDEAEGFI